MNIWILTKKHRKRSYQAKRFEEEAEQLGVKVLHVVSSEFEIEEPSSRPGQIWYNGEYVDVPDVLITRVMGMSHFAYALVRLFQRMGVPVMNSAQSIEIAEDKMRSIQVLTAKGLPIPESILAKMPVDTDFVVEKLGFPMIMKTALGAKGEGVVMLENARQLRDVVTVLQTSTEGKTALIFQRFVEDSFGRDVRVMVVGGQAIGAAIRCGAEGNFKANVAAGGSADFFEMNEELANLAVRATEAVGLEISGVDFLFDGDSFVIGEVNSSPSFNGFDVASGVNVPRLILERAIAVAQSD